MTAAEFLQLPPEERRLLVKQQIFELIHGGPVPLKELAFYVGRSYRDFLKLGEEAETSKNMRLDELVRVQQLTGNLAVLDWLEGLFGRLAFRLPGPHTSLAELNRQITAVLKETAEAVQAVIRAVEPDSPGGGRITEAELAEIDREIKEAHQHLAALQAAVRRLGPHQVRYPKEGGEGGA